MTRRDETPDVKQSFAYLIARLSENPAVVSECGHVEWRCSLCDPWSTSDPSEANAHHKLMNTGKKEDSQWFHRIYPVTRKATPLESNDGKLVKSDNRNEGASTAEMVQVPRQTLEEFQRVLDDSLNRLRRLEQRLDKVGVQ